MRLFRFPNAVHLQMILIEIELVCLGRTTNILSSISMDGYRSVSGGLMSDGLARAS